MFYSDDIAPFILLKNIKNILMKRFCTLILSENNKKFEIKNDSYLQIFCNGLELLFSLWRFETL
jgi:hypothetical protein